MVRVLVPERFRWYVDHGINEGQLRLRPHDPEELSHYSSGTADVEFAYPWGWGELEGVANRTDYDLKQHAKFSGEDLTYFDQENDRRYLPHVIEPAAGADRATLAFLLAAYDEEEVRGEKRTVLRFHPAPRAHQGCGTAVVEEREPHAGSRRSRGAAATAPHDRLRRGRFDRTPLPPSGRSGNTVVCHRRFRHDR